MARSKASRYLRCDVVKDDPLGQRVDREQGRCIRPRVGPPDLISETAVDNLHAEGHGSARVPDLLKLLPVVHLNSPRLKLTPASSAWTAPVATQQQRPSPKDRLSRFPYCFTLPVTAPSLAAGSSGGAMFDRYDPRDDDRDDRDRGRDLDRGGRGGGDAPDRQEGSRDVFTRDLDLPRGRERERARDRNRVYDIDGSEARMLATVGSFRVVAERDLSALRDDGRSRGRASDTRRRRSDSSVAARRQRPGRRPNRVGQTCLKPIARSRAPSGRTSLARRSTPATGSRSS